MMKLFFVLLLRSVVILVPLVLILAPFEQVQGAVKTLQPLPASCLSVGWPQDASDLQADPALTFGHLANGLRYVLMPNSEPKNRVALYLNVQAGSIHESDTQRGVAHFLEHMLFNGTTHYPPGTLVEYFQSLGMSFGADTNAHTSFDETVYKLLLPSAEPKVLAEGFKVLADYARGALLLEEEVDRERGIILAEKRSRDSAASRVSKKQLRFDFAGTLVAQRSPIGVTEVLETADSRLLRSYYDRWYRPENIFVVVVGDIDPQETVKLLEQAFSTLKGVDVTGSCPEMGRVREAGIDVLILPEPELGYTGLTLTTVFNIDPQPDTLQWEIEQLRQYVAMGLLANRLEQLEQAPASFIVQPRAQAGNFLRRYGYASLTAQTESDQWRESLSILQSTLAQVLQDGFTETELARGKREVSALLERAVQTASTRDSKWLAGLLIRKLNNGEVIMSPAQEMATYGPALEKISLAEVNAAIDQVWNRPRRLIHLIGDVELGSSSQEQMEEQLREAYQANKAKPVSAWVEGQRPPFPYLELPDTPAEMIEQLSHKEIGVESFLFKGGIRLNIKATDFQANQVLLSMQLGRGQLAEPAPGMALMAEAVVQESGIGNLTNEQLAEALAGTNIALGFKVGPESFSFNGSSLSNEFELLLQLLRHQIDDPAFRPEAFHRSREDLRRMYNQLMSTAEGVQSVEGGRFLAGASPEYGLATWQQVEKIELPQVKDWLAPAFARDTLEINVVGDIDPKEAMRLVAKHFGDAQRNQEETVLGKPIIFPAGKDLRLPVASSIDRALLTVAWKTSDFWDIGRTRRLNVLASVFNDRLRVQIREELGAAYGPQVSSHPSRVHAGFGLMQGSLIVAPEQAHLLAGIIKDVAANLGTKGVSEEELRRALEPTLTSIKDMKRNNGYWMEAVLNLSGHHPQQLQWPLSIEEGFAEIKAEDLTALARQYLTQDRAATVIVSPKF